MRAGAGWPAGPSVGARVVLPWLGTDGGSCTVRASRFFREVVRLRAHGGPCGASVRSAPCPCARCGLPHPVPLPPLFAIRMRITQGPICSVQAAPDMLDVLRVGGAPFASGATLAACGVLSLPPIRPPRTSRSERHEMVAYRLFSRSIRCRAGCTATAISADRHWQLASCGGGGE